MNDNKAARIAEIRKRQVERRRAHARAAIRAMVFLAMAMTIFVALLVFMGLMFVAMLVCLGLLPGLSALAVDRRKDRKASHTVMLFNIAGLLPSLYSIAVALSPNETARSMLYDSFTWLYIYGFAAFGWMVVFVLPQIAFLVLTVRSDHMINKLEHKKKQLLDEWGDKIRE